MYWKIPGTFRCDYLRSVIIAGVIALLPLQGMATEVSQFSDIVAKGDVKLDLRYRFEHVDQDGFSDNASASLLKSRLSFSTAAYRGWSALIEVDDVTAIGSDDYNSTENGYGHYPVVADPEGTAINQVLVKYQGKQSTTTAGRQRILHDDQRFLGGVGWRQNEQTYDAFRIEWKPQDALALDLAYIANVDRIFGPENGANPADLEGDSYAARLRYQLSGEHELSAFGYWLDFDDQRTYPAGKTVNNSSDTYGLTYKGKIGPAAIGMTWAEQSDGGGSLLTYDTHYYGLNLGMSLGPLAVKVGREVLAADNGVGFKTPLATLHKFQGWADKFLGTPADGMEDNFISVSGSLGPVKLMAVYHDFSAEASSSDFGSEIDAVATWPLHKLVTLQAKYAAFSTDDNSRYTDTDKLWFTVQLKL